MSEKERDQARERMKESWAKRMREAKERHSRDGDRDHGDRDRDHRGDHGKRDAQHAGSSHGKPSGDHGKSHGKPSDHQGKPEARQGHSSHGHSSILSRMKDKRNGMNEKGKDAARDRMLGLRREASRCSLRFDRYEDRWLQAVVFVQTEE